MKKERIKFWLLTAAIIFLVAGSLAYILTGQQWPVGTVLQYYINPNTDQVANEATAVRNAADSWSQIFPAGLRFSYSGTTSATTYGYNNNNTVCWSDDGNNDTLATAYWWYYPSTDTTFEADLVFNDWYNWFTSGSQYDIETVALHEFGHWIGLSHSSTGIMRDSYSGLRRAIDNDARSGFQFIYGSEQEDYASIQLDRSSLAFIGSIGYTNPPPQHFRVRNAGEQTLNFQIGSNRSWINFSPSNGSSAGEWREIAVTVNISRLSVGSYSGSIAVTSSNADNSPQALRVNLTNVKDQPPTVSITSPLNGAAVSKNVSVKAQASDDKGIKKVEFYINNKLMTTDHASPFEWAWDTTVFTSGMHTIKARAYDTINQMADDSIQVKVDQPPMVFITSPLKESDVSSVVPIKASAFDDFGIRRVQFYVNGVLKGTDSSAPHGYNWDTASISNGGYRIKTICIDTIDQMGQDEIDVVVIPHVPLNFAGKKQNNSSVLLEQYISVLTWEANILDKDIRYFRVFFVEENQEILLAEVDAGIFEYIHRNVAKDKTNRYVLRAIDNGGREGEAASLEVR